MNNRESLEFIRTYFDDDIGDPGVDHIRNSKEYLRNLFMEKPTINVDVKDAVPQDGVISAFLEWFVTEKDVKRVMTKGVAIFVLREQKILKRHTYIYDRE